MTVTKECAGCKIVMYDVAHSRLYCTYCSKKRNIEQTNKRKERDKISQKKHKKKNIEESWYYRVSGRKRITECDGSPFF